MIEQYANMILSLLKSHEEEDTLTNSDKPATHHRLFFIFIFTHFVLLFLFFLFHYLPCPSFTVCASCVSLRVCVGILCVCVACVSLRVCVGILCVCVACVSLRVCVGILYVSLISLFTMPIVYCMRGTHIRNTLGTH